MFVSIYVILTGFIIYLKLGKFLSIQSDEYSIHSYSLKTNMTLKHISKDTGSFYRLYFKAFEVNYSLSLYQDDSIYSSTIKIFICRLDRVRSYYLRNSLAANVYIGTEDISNGISVFGYYSNGIVFGRIDMNDEVIYVEPFTEDKQLSHQSEKVNEVTSLHKYEKIIHDHKDQIWRKSIHHYGHFDPVSSNPTISIRNVFSIKPQWICSLELLVDYTYLVNRSLEAVISEMLFYVMNVNLVFRSLDLDKDGKLDGIGFVIEKITIFEYRNSLRNPVQIDTNDDTEFLEHLSRYRHPYCMLICFCSRGFRIASTGKSGENKESGRICPEIPNLEKWKDFNSNVGSVTDFENTEYVPRFITVSNLLHQLGHAFGCKDDKKTDAICSPGDFNGNRRNYIMYPLEAQKPNNWRFSSCCLDDMIQIINTKVGSLNKTLKSLCNNVVAGEKSNFSIKYAKQCDNKTGCIPGVTECCNESCDIISRKENKICYSNHICYNASSICDGVNPSCPKVLEPNGTSCSSAGFCFNGKCIDDICKANDLEPCNCLSPEEICHVCCNSKFNICQTAESLKLVAFEKSLLKMYGIGCFNNQGKCSSNGTCEIEHKENQYFKTYTNIIYYLIPIPIIIGIFILIRFFHRSYVRNPPLLQDRLVDQMISSR